MLHKMLLLILALLLASCSCVECQEGGTPDKFVRARQIIWYYTPVGTTLIGTLEGGRVRTVLVSLENSCYMMLDRSERRMVPIDCQSAHSLVEKHGIPYKAENPR